MHTMHPEINRGGALSSDISSVAPAASKGAAARGPKTCVLHVTPGSELTMCRRVAKVAARHLSDCYVPQSQLPMRIQGVWELRDSVIFPGYVFLQTSNVPGLETDLALITDYNRLLRTDGGVSALTPEEARIVRDLCGTDHYLPVSWGEIVRGRLHVSRGPLMGRESSIIKIDRHKRSAWLRAGVLGRSAVRVGLEVPVKT